jgi:sulfhydrogenase subunit alpha
MKNRTVKVEALARVEGEGGIHVRVKAGKLDDVKLVIFEPPRFFEAFLRGRRFDEAPDITARICGICPVAYQMSSSHAMEQICGVKVDGQLRELRRLLYCGEWIESHALHVYMLHTPDFLGYEDAIQLAGDYPEIVKKALELKKIGNDLMCIVGGREIHPINVRIGGFYRVPTKQEVRSILDKLKWARDVSVETTRFVSGFKFPDFEHDYEFVALHHPNEYPFNEGRLISNKGLDIDLAHYESNFAEEHVEHSNSLQSIHVERGPYFVGPIARYNLNFDQLSPMAKEVARDVKLDRPVKNPFKGIIVRAVELVYACEEAIRIIEAYEPPAKPCVEVVPKEGVGYGCTEAPRGICFHKYRIDSDGIIQDAKIVPPTSQNLRTMESDLSRYVTANMHLGDAELTWQCEQAVRNYDPCISCATHALKLHIERS